MTQLQTATARLFAQQRGITLEAFVQLERAKGSTWRAIAREVTEASGVPLTHQSLVNWYGELVAA